MPIRHGRSIGATTKMAKILTFRNKESAASGQTFLTDETEKLSFRIAEDGAVSIGSISSAALPMLPDPRKDWRNQELADLFRVRQILSGANVPVETMRGITDEGDPWFVFCHLNGDVFIHMARIDELYVLDSPNVCRPLRGHNFNALIDDFTSLALPKTTDEGESTEHRVIRLERGGKVRLHPSAMLAALIWTLFLASEDLVLHAAEEQTVDGDDLLDFSDEILTADSVSDVQSLTTETSETVELGTSETMKDSHQAVQHSTSDEAQSEREVNSQQGLVIHQNSYTIGLSTIAIALGFMSEAVFKGDRGEVLEGLELLEATDYAISGEANPELNQFADGGGDTLVQMLADFLNISFSSDAKDANASAAGAVSNSIQQDTRQANVDIEDKIVDQTATTFRGDVIDPTGIIEVKATPLPSDAISIEATLASADVQKSTPTISVNNLIATNAAYLEAFQMDNTTIMASFDINKAEALILSDYIIDEDQNSTKHYNFDGQVESFINFIHSKDVEIGIIINGDAIIMIDRSAYAYDEYGKADTYYLTWEDDYGQVVSVIGLKSDFQDFDLIA